MQGMNPKGADRIAGNTEYAGQFKYSISRKLCFSFVDDSCHQTSWAPLLRGNPHYILEFSSLLLVRHRNRIVFMDIAGRRGSARMGRRCAQLSRIYWRHGGPVTEMRRNCNHKHLHLHWADRCEADGSSHVVPAFSGHQRKLSFMVSNAHYLFV